MATEARGAVRWVEWRGPLVARRPEIVSPARTFPQSISAHTSARDALARMTRQVYAGLVTAPGRSVRSALLVSVALLLLAPGPAAARTRSSYDPAAKRLTVITDREGFSDVIRRGQQIVVRGGTGGPVACRGGLPTVLNTDSITLAVRGEFDFVDLLLGGGPFAPGASPEADGAPEIEIRFRGPDLLGGVVGTPGDDHFHWGPGGGKPGLNLNPDADTDIDVTIKGTTPPFLGIVLDIAFLTADGAGGDDRISTTPAPVGEAVWADGGPGNDVLEAHPRNGGVLEGQSGSDLLRGGPVSDELSGGGGPDRLLGGGARGQTLVAGPGRDLIRAGRGSDRIRVRDGWLDTVACGPGSDRVRADPKDRLSRCELVRRSPRPAGRG